MALERAGPDYAARRCGCGSGQHTPLRQQYGLPPYPSCAMRAIAGAGPIVWNLYEVCWDVFEVYPPETSHIVVEFARIVDSDKTVPWLVSDQPHTERSAEPDGVIEVWHGMVAEIALWEEEMRRKQEKGAARRACDAAPDGALQAGVRGGRLL